MLRVIVISLFVANLLLLAFQQSKPVDQSVDEVNQPSVVDSDIPTIYLASELWQDWNLMSGSRKCFSLGPLYSIDERDELREQLLGGSAYISERQTEARVEKGFWVYFPPYGSLVEANRVRLSLQAAGFKDIEVIYEGEWKNSISLGYFLVQKNALKRKKALENRGYAPSLRVQRQTEPRFWLDYEQNPGSSLITLELKNRPNDLIQRSTPCPESDQLDGLDVMETSDGAETGKG